MSLDEEESHVCKDDQEAEAHCREHDDEEQRLSDCWSHGSC